MKVMNYENYIKGKYEKKTWIALGNFDGVHVAHQQILKDAAAHAKEYGTIPTVLLFEPHPEIYFKDRKDFLLTTFEEKIEKIRQCGIELAVVKDFETEFAKKSPLEFAKWIKESLNAAGVSIGYDYTFGAKKQGKAEDLMAYGKSLNFWISTVPPVKSEDQIPISSSLCRELLKNGRPDEASKYLNSPYNISGPVVKGDGRGKTLGFPTANIEPPANKLLPCRGVYLVKVRKNNESHWGICNIGLRPTFDKKIDTIEIHLLDFDEIIYDCSLTLYFIEYIRPEKYFETPDALAIQMEKDLNVAKDKISKSLH
ncbi:bifunctional riboflavin kinase/FAD synthetase [Natranaerofaba carboxydovora]|uniref:bifunctional riboflavin kinase/FAD synthetase n=1 Tax=Natranaerofaba carboxydovora TaxID=2742683 RepID=UPI001F12A6A7|nr:bifunctional riboflavin kinase/FAD synthetase [Natranaerofaba carboxydovora]UMZ73414.1 Riboflavin biosynthesis protein RibF [Natranaerofaba carboxydovora]